MDIASASMDMHMTRTQVSAGYAVMKNAMEEARVQAAGLLRMMDQAAVPSFGHSLDIRV